MPCERWSLIRYVICLLLKICTSFKSACIGLHVKLLLPRTGYRHFVSRVWWDTLDVVG